MNLFLRIDRLYLKSVFLNLIIFIASILITLLIMEVIFRAANIHEIYYKPRVDEVILGRDSLSERKPYAFIPFSIIKSTYDSNPRGYFDHGNIIYHKHNSAGWRDVEHSIKKTQDIYRILGLGDSYLWGQGVRYEDIVHTKLEKYLKNKINGIKVETVNTGISGTNTRYQLNLLKDVGLQYTPDLTIVYFVLNDVEDNLDGNAPKIEFFRNYISIYQTPDELSKYSYLWSWVRQRYLQSICAYLYIQDCVKTFDVNSPKWTRCRSALNEIHQVCLNHNIPVLIVIFPFFYNLDGNYPFQKMHDVVRTCLQDTGIHVLDLRDYYRKFHGPELWVHPTDQHPNEIAHDIAAQAIAEYLTQHSKAFGLNN